MGAFTRALPVAGSINSPARVSAPKETLDRNDSIGVTWGPRKRSKQPANNLGHARFLIVGCKFNKWDYDKIARLHSWMRNLETGFADPFVSVHKDIQIERPWAIADLYCAVPPEFPLDPKQPLKQGVRVQTGLQGDHCIEKARLVREAHRLSGIER